MLFFYWIYKKGYVKILKGFIRIDKQKDKFYFRINYTYKRNLLRFWKIFALKHMINKPETLNKGLKNIFKNSGKESKVGLFD